MKKQRIKTLLKHGILLFGISLFITNCNNDDQSIMDESQLKQTTPLVLNQKIPFEQTQHYNKLEEKINKVKEKASNYNSQNRTDNDDIEILTNEVLYITYASTHTYSFKILRTEPQAYVENIVLHYNIETQGYNEYLVQYHIPAEEFVNLHNGDLLQSSENVTIIDLENGFFDSNIQARGCERSCSTIFVSCSSGAHTSENVGQWVSCTEDQRGGSLPYAYQSCSTNCDQDNEITAPDGPSGGGGGGGNTTVVSNPLPTEPCDTNDTGGIGITGSNGDCLTVNPRDPIIQNPCDNINSLLQNNDIKTKLQNLKTPATLNLDYEKGFDLTTDDTNSLSATPNNGDAGNTNIDILIPEDGSMSGFIHSHYNGLSPVFTIDDIKTLNGIYQWRKYRGKPLKDLTAIVVSQGGVYALVIDDESAFATEGYKLQTADFLTPKTGIKAKFNEKLKGTHTIEKVERLMVDNGLPTYGLSMYKASNDLTSWSKVEPNPNNGNNTITTPCN